VGDGSIVARSIITALTGRGTLQIEKAPGAQRADPLKWEVYWLVPPHAALQCLDTG
jgi:hypothetical protein